jgi:hypothetical protein
MEIKWPEKYSMENTSVHVSNDLEIPAPPEVIWAWLVRASRWPEWYPAVTRVLIESGGEDLVAGSKFSWRIFGVNLSSKVEEFIPYERFAWSAQYEGVDAYHAWLIEKKTEGCRVLTEENQKGWLARLNNTLRPSNVRYYHHLWLESLMKKAKEGYPPGSSIR